MILLRVADGLVFARVADEFGVGLGIATGEDGVL